MSAPCTLVQEPDAWRVSNRTGESMTVHIEEILHDSSHDLGVDPGLVKGGVERHLQELLADPCPETPEANGAAACLAAPIT